MSHSVADHVVRSWIEKELRTALSSDEFINKHTAVLMIARSKGASSEEAIRNMVASMVLDVAGMPANERDN